MWPYYHHLQNWTSKVYYTSRSARRDQKGSSSSYDKKELWDITLLRRLSTNKFIALDNHKQRFYSRHGANENQNEKCTAIDTFHVPPDASLIEGAPPFFNKTLAKSIYKIYKARVWLRRSNQRLVFAHHQRPCNQKLTPCCVQNAPRELIGFFVT